MPAEGDAAADAVAGPEGGVAAGASVRAAPGVMAPGRAAGAAIRDLIPLGSVALLINRVKLGDGDGDGVKIADRESSG